MELSDRYISDRFLPDKAIDLLDEAASRLKIEVSSKPEELDELDRRIIQIKIELSALKKEKDENSKKKVKILSNELEELESKSMDLNSKWLAEKSKMHSAQKLSSWSAIQEGRAKRLSCSNRQQLSSSHISLAPTTLEKVFFFFSNLANIRLNFAARGDLNASLLRLRAEQAAMADPTRPARPRCQHRLGPCKSGRPKNLNCCCCCC